MATINCNSGKYCGQTLQHADVTVWRDGSYDSILPLDGKREPKTTYTTLHVLYFFYLFIYFYFCD